MSTTSRLTTRTLPRALMATVAASGLFAVSACTTEGAEDPANNDGQETVAETATEEATAGPTETDGGTAPDSGADLTATMNNADGSEVGTVEISEVEGSLEFMVTVSGLEPGFYGLHIHEIGECQPDSAAPDDPQDTGDFMSAGGHLGSDEADHPDHAGDLPQLLVQNSGEGLIGFQTDRLTLADLQDDDGSAMMIHTDADNFANIPERYAPEGPDADTTSTGDAGDRLACGVVEA